MSHTLNITVCETERREDLHHLKVPSHLSGQALFPLASLLNLGFDLGNRGVGVTFWGHARAKIA